jgi:hypothetical protein
MRSWMNSGVCPYRLQWLEEANLFVNKSIGLKRKAQFDKRFEGCIPKRQKKAG